MLAYGFFYKVCKNIEHIKFFSATWICKDFLIPVNLADCCLHNPPYSFYKEHAINRCIPVQNSHQKQEGHDGPGPV